MSLPTPYYDEGGIVIYCGDCKDLLPHLRADTIATDAPFAIKDEAFKMGTKYNRRGDNDYHPPSDWDLAFDPAWGPLVCASAPVVAWFGNWRKRPEVEAMMPHPIRCEIVWAKDMHVGPPCPAAMRDERIWLFSAAGFKGRHFETTVWDEPVIQTWAHKYHKNQKPELLMSRLIRWTSDAGQTIGDPFMGSGTTLTVAKALGRKAWGIDKSEEHCRSAVERLRHGTATVRAKTKPGQGDLFAAVDE